jgi:hypothetical protein
LLNAVRIRDFLNETLKECLLTAVLVNTAFFYFLLDFGVIDKEYRWIIILFGYAWAMTGWGISLFNLLIVVLERAKMGQ